MEGNMGNADNSKRLVMPVEDRLYVYYTIESIVMGANSRWRLQGFARPPSIAAAFLDRPEPT